MLIYIFYIYILTAYFLSYLFWARAAMQSLPPMPHSAHWQPYKDLQKLTWSSEGRVAGTCLPGLSQERTFPCLQATVGCHKHWQSTEEQIPMAPEV